MFQNFSAFLSWGFHTTSVFLLFVRCFFFLFLYSLSSTVLQIMIVHTRKLSKNWEKKISKTVSRMMQKIIREFEFHFWILLVKTSLLKFFIMSIFVSFSVWTYHYLEYGRWERIEKPKNNKLKWEILILCAKPTMQKCKKVLKHWVLNCRVLNLLRADRTIGDYQYFEQLRNN